MQLKARSELELELNSALNTDDEVNRELLAGAISSQLSCGPV